MPTLAIFVHQLVPTGVARNAIAIARHMQQAGWRTVLITIRPGGELAPLAEGLELLTVGGSGLPRKLELVQTIGSLRRAIEAIAPDILMSSGNHAHLATLSASRGFPRGHRPKTVYRISNDTTHSKKLSGLGASLSLRRLTTQLVAAEATRLALVSPLFASDPLFTEAVRAGKAQVIANGVDVAAVRWQAGQPCDHPWAGGQVPIVLAVGRLARQKNFKRLVRAFALARMDRPLRLMIVGGGKRKSLERLQALAAELDVASDIAFVGRVCNPFPYYRAASMLVLPSVWEGSSNVLLEALACDVPVAASRTAGPAEEVLGEGRFGALFDPLDPADMARALLQQLDPERRVLPVDRAQAFDREQTLRRYRTLFEEMLAEE